MLLKRLGGLRPYGADIHALQDAEVRAPASKPLEEEPHSVGAGEDHPLVGLDNIESAVQFGPACGRHDVDARKLDGRGAAVDEHFHKHARLVPGTGDHDALAEERLGLVPVQFFPQLHHLAHDDDCGRAQPRFLHFLDDVLQRAGSDPLVRPRPPLNEGHGSINAPAVRDEVVHDVLEVLHTHEEHEGADPCCDPVPMHF